MILIIYNSTTGEFGSENRPPVSISQIICLSSSLVVLDFDTKPMFFLTILKFIIFVLLKTIHIETSFFCRTSAAKWTLRAKVVVCLRCF